MARKSETGNDIELRDAELLGRQFNTALTNTMAYGAEHDVPARAIDHLAEGLLNNLRKQSAITIILDREMLYIERHIINRKFNATRLINLFRRTGVESVTFNHGLARNQVEILMGILADPESYPDPDTIKAVLDKSGANNIRVNHIMYRKVTSDEEIVTQDELEDLTDMSARSVLKSSGETGASTGSGGRLESNVLEKMSAVFTLKDLLAQPDQIATDLLEMPGDTDTATRSDVAARIRRLSDEINTNEGTTDTPVSLSEVMTSVHALRRELHEGLTAQKQVGRFFAEDDPVIDEIDQLTYRTVLSLVRGEYRSGDFSAERLAQLLRRMLPDTRDLKRLLPQLKDCLLAEGMSLPDYLNCVNELTAELRDESLIRVLEEGADDIGLSVDEIMDTIRRDPEEAARLMVLAAELRRGTADDDARLSEVMAEYVERVSGKMAVDSGESAIRSDSGNTLRKVVGRIQEELVVKLKNQGISPRLAARVDEQLQNRFQKTLDSVKSEWLIELAAKADQIPRNDLIKSVEQVLERKSDLDTLAEPLEQALSARGLTPEEVRSTTTGFADRLRHRSGERPMAARILSPEDTAWFMEREIKSGERYGTQFSCIMMMLVAVKPPEQSWRPVTREDNDALIPEVIRAMAGDLRDLDFMGSYQATGQAMPLVILPMTPEDGATIVKRRLLESIGGSDFPLGSELVELRAALSVCAYDPERTPDLKSFIQTLRGRLAGELVAVSKRTRD